MNYEHNFVVVLRITNATQMPRDVKRNGAHAHLQTSLSKRDFSGYIGGARSHEELTFTNTFSYKHEKTNSNNNNNNNNNHHGS